MGSAEQVGTHFANAPSLAGFEDFAQGGGPGLIGNRLASGRKLPVVVFVSGFGGTHPAASLGRASVLGEEKGPGVQPLGTPSPSESARFDALP